MLQVIVVAHDQEAELEVQTDAWDSYEALRELVVDAVPNMFRDTDELTLEYKNEHGRWTRVKMKVRTLLLVPDLTPERPRSIGARPDGRTKLFDSRIVCRRRLRLSRPRGAPASRCRLAPAAGLSGGSEHLVTSQGCASCLSSSTSLHSSPRASRVYTCAWLRRLWSV